MQMKYLRLLATVTLSASLAIFPWKLSSQAKPQISASISQSPKVPIRGSVHPAIAQASDLGSVAPNLAMERMVLLLKPAPEQQKELDALIAAQHNSSSPLYHKWLKPEEFASRFAPAQEDVAKIRGWLESEGFRIESVSRGGMWILFSGTASQVGSTFQTELHQYKVEGQNRIANASPVSLPQALTSVAHGIVSLNNIPRRPMNTGFKRISLNGTANPSATAASAGAVAPNYTGGASTHYLSPNDLATIYNTKPLLKNSIDGSNVSIAIIGQSDVQLADIQSFRSIFSLPKNDPEIIVVGPDPGVSSASGDEGESDLDLEYAGAIAPQAHIKFVEAGTTFASAGIDLAAAYAVDNVIAPIVSLSYGACEATLGTTGNAFYNQLWEQAASEGITVLVSSGDAGSAGCNYAAEGYAATLGLQVNGLASTPYNTAVGGTQFNESVSSGTAYWNPTNDNQYSSAIGYIPETVWNESCNAQTDPTGCAIDNGYTVLYAGSGGRSSCLNLVAVQGAVLNCSGAYAKPDWQVGLGVPIDGVRDLPDVSLTAAFMHDGFLVCEEGSCQTAYQNGVLQLRSATIVGGTSASTPSMAGILALLEQQNGQYQGQVNYGFYKLAATQSVTACDSSQLTNPTVPSSCVFHDITAGTNSVPCTGTTQDCSSSLNGVNGYLSGYAATPGYDMASGLGSVDAFNLVNSWSSLSPLPTTTMLATATASITHGTALSFTVGVTPTSGTGTPTGDFSLNANGQSVGPFTLANQGYSGSTNALPGGTYNLTAHYAGNSMYEASDSKAVQVTVKPENSTISILPYYVTTQGNLRQISGPIPFGAYLYATTSIAGVSGNGVPTGTVTYFLDGSSLGALPLDSTGALSFVVQAYLSSGAILPGTHTLTASYSGDASFNPSTTSTVYTFTVTTGEIASFAIPNVTTLKAGQLLSIAPSLNWVANVYPTGTLQLYDNGMPLGGTITLDPKGSAPALYNTSSLSVGTHVLTTTYSGDKNYSPVVPGAFNQSSSTVTVTPATLAQTKTLLTVSASKISVGQTVTYTVQVSPTNSSTATPTGTVTLINPDPGVYSSTILAATPLTNGSLQVTLPLYNAGALTLFASYSGDSNFDPSISPIILTTIQTIAPTVALAPNSLYSAPGVQNSLNFTVTGKPNNPNYNVPTGQVMYYDSLNGGSQVLIGYDSISLGNGNIGVDSLAVKLDPGTHVITAKYLGDTVWSSATATATVIVSNPDFSLNTPTGTTLVNVGSTAASDIGLSSILNYAGTVNLSCGSGVPVGVSCSISPSSVALNGSGSAQINLQSTAAASPLSMLKAQNTESKKTVNSLLSGGEFVCCVLLLGAFAKRRKATLRYLPILLGAITLFTLGCGSSAKPTYTVTLNSVNGVKAASGSTVHLAATVSASNGSSSPRGTVSFYDGTTLLGNVAIINGVANFESSSLAVGTHTITAQYTASDSSVSKSSPLYQAITGAFTIQVSAVSGSLNHTIAINFQLQ